MADKTLKVTITAEVAKFKKGVEEAQSKLKKFAPQTEAEMQQICDRYIMGFAELL